MRHAIPVTVVSDGLDRTISTLLRRAGLTELPVIANHIEPIGGDRWRLTAITPTAQLGVQAARRERVAQPVVDDILLAGVIERLVQ